MRAHWIPYCKGHYTLDFCKDLATHLRKLNKYKAVKLGYYIKEDNKTYCKIYVQKAGHMKTVCLHNKSGQVRTYKDLVMKIDGEGNCWDCTYHPEENKGCRKFYPITLSNIRELNSWEVNKRWRLTGRTELMS